MEIDYGRSNASRLAVHMLIGMCFGVSLQATISVLIGGSGSCTSEA